VLVLVTGLNLWNPLEAADPYNLDRVARIGEVGTLAYDPDAEIKTNILSPVYELLAADLQQIPLVGQTVVRLHGVLGLLLYVAAIGAVRELLGARAGWPWTVMLAVPVVFHQLVLFKNDLFVGVLGVVVLAWVLTRVGTAGRTEIVWASWLAGIAVAIKLTSLPLAVILAAAVVLERGERWRALAHVVLGTAAGALAGGLVFTLAENLRVYGDMMPSEGIGSRYAGVTDLLVGVFRFGLSLVDLGLLTRDWWPGRGGWGGTFGLPLIWAFIVLAAGFSWSPHVRRTALIAVVYFVAFAVGMPDADLSHRLALAPGLLVIAVAVHIVNQDMARTLPFRVALVPVVALSAAQIVRSAYLYLLRA
jgi:hypothetical protein